MLLVSQCVSKIFSHMRRIIGSHLCVTSSPMSAFPPADINENRARPVIKNSRTEGLKRKEEKMQCSSLPPDFLITSPVRLKRSEHQHEAWRFNLMPHGSQVRRSQRHVARQAPGSENLLFSVLLWRRLLDQNCWF